MNLEFNRIIYTFVIGCKFNDWKSMQIIRIARIANQKQNVIKNLTYTPKGKNATHEMERKKNKK